MEKPILYQLLPRLWGNLCPDPVRSGTLSRNGTGKFSSVDVPTLAYLRNMGVTHVWYTGVVRHATTEAFEGCPASNPRIVKGLAGSPYAIVDYYDVNPYLAENVQERMLEFESLLKRTHAAGLKALIDFVPNHVSRDYGKKGWVNKEAKPFGADDDCTVHWKPENDFYYYPGQRLELPVSDGEPYPENPAKASGNRFCPSPSVEDWYETVRLNYGEEPNSTWEKMFDIVRWWCRKGVDGFRCDMVEMVPWQFLQALIRRIKAEFPEVIFLAEVYEPEQYSFYADVVGFDFLYDKSGLYDVLRSVFQGDSARKITSNWQSLGSLQPRMLNFLENHDEQRFASDFFGGDARKSYALLGASLFLNTSPFLIYFGEEVGERGMDAEGFSGLDGRTSIFDWWSSGSLRRLYTQIHTGTGLSECEQETLERYSGLFRLARTPVISSGKTFDLGYCNLDTPGFDPDRHFAFLRSGAGKTLLFFCNFSPVPTETTLRMPPEAFDALGIPLEDGVLPRVSVRPFDLAIVRLSFPIG